MFTNFLTLCGEGVRKPVVLLGIEIGRSSVGQSGSQNKNVHAF